MDTPESSTALTVHERASVALKSAACEVRLRELVKESLEITAVTNADSYKQLHSARMKLKGERVQLTKEGKDARDDAAKFAKAVITEEARLVGIIEPEEKRLEAIQRDYDARIERERQAKAEAEQRRIAHIQAAIAEIVAVADRLSPTSGSVVIETAMQKVLAAPVSEEEFHEFTDEALKQKSATMVRLNGLHAAALTYEAEQRQIRADREELARRREADEAREREAAAKEAAETEARNKLRWEAEQRAERLEEETRLRLAAEDRAAQERRDEADRVARIAREAEDRKREERAAEIRAQQEQLDRDRRELEERQRAERQAREDAERKEREEKESAERYARQQAEDARLAAEAEARAKREKLEAQEREEALAAAKLADAETMLRTFVEKYGDLAQYKPVVKVIRAILDPRKAVANG